MISSNQNMNLLLSTTTLLLVTLARAQVPPKRPTWHGGNGGIDPAGGGGGVAPGIVSDDEQSNGQFSPSNGLGGPENGRVGKGNVPTVPVGKFVPGQLYGGRKGHGGPPGLHGRRDNHWHRPSGGSFVRNTGPPTIFQKFPSCQNIDMDIRETYLEMWRHRQIGPTVNRCSIQNLHECMYRDMTAARCNARTKPSEQCIHEVMAYVRGTNCSTEDTTTDATTVGDTTVTTLLQ